MKLISLLSILFFPLLIDSSGNDPCTREDLATEGYSFADSSKVFVHGTVLGPKIDGKYLVCKYGQWNKLPNQEECNFDLFESIAEPTKNLIFSSERITISCPLNYFFEHNANLSTVDLKCQPTSDGKFAWHTETLYGDIENVQFVFSVVENPIKCVFCDLPSLFLLAKKFNLVVNLPTSDDKFSFPLECKKNFVLPVPQADLKATCLSGTWEINWTFKSQSCERKTCDSTKLLDADVDVKMTFELNGKKFFLE